MGLAQWPRLRPAQATDASALRVLLGDVHPDAHAHADGDPTASAARHTAVLDAGGDGLLGVVMVDVEGVQASLELLAVGPAMRGEGLGGRLLRYAVDVAEDGGAQALRAHPRDAAGDAFLRVHGFAGDGQGALALRLRAPGTG